MNLTGGGVDCGYEGMLQGCHVCHYGCGASAVG